MPAPRARFWMSLAAGGAYAAALFFGLPQPVWQVPAAPAVRVTMRVTAPAPQQTMPRERLPIEVSSAAVPPKRTSPAPAEQPSPASQPAAVPTVSTPLGSQATIPEFEPSVLPAATESAPPAPPDEAPALVYRDAPGGDVLVLGLHIDHTGLVLETKVLIASRFAMEDLTFALAMRGQYFSRVEPPLPLGQTRWVQARVPYSPDTQSVLP